MVQVDDARHHPSAEGFRWLSAMPGILLLSVRPRRETATARHGEIDHRQRPELSAQARSGARQGAAPQLEVGLDQQAGRPMTPLAASTFVWVFILLPLVIVWAHRLGRHSSPAAIGSGDGRVDRHRPGAPVRGYARLLPTAQADAGGASTPAGDRPPSRVSPTAEPT